MTDVEAMLAMLNRAGIKFERENETREIWAGGRKIAGYQAILVEDGLRGSCSEMIFDLDGTLVSIESRE